MWCVGGFDGQRTLGDTTQIDISALGKLEASSHSTTPDTFSREPSAQGDGSKPASDGTQSKQVKEENLQSVATSQTAPTVEEPVTTPLASLALHCSAEGAKPERDVREGCTSSPDPEAETVQLNCGSAQGWRGILPGVTSLFWGSQSRRDNDDQDRSPSKKRMAPERPAGTASIDDATCTTLNRSNSIEDLGVVAEGNSRKHDNFSTGVSGQTSTQEGSQTIAGPTAGEVADHAAAKQRGTLNSMRKLTAVFKSPSGNHITSTSLSAFVGQAIALLFWQV